MNCLEHSICGLLANLGFFQMHDSETSNEIEGFRSTDFVGKTQTFKKKNALYNRNSKCQFRIVHLKKILSYFFTLTFTYYPRFQRKLNQKGPTRGSYFSWTVSFYLLVDRVCCKKRHKKRIRTCQNFETQRSFG